MSPRAKRPVREAKALKGLKAPSAKALAEEWNRPSESMRLAVRQVVSLEAAAKALGINAIELPAIRKSLEAIEIATTELATKGRAPERSPEELHATALVTELARRQDGALLAFYATALRAIEEELASVASRGLVPAQVERIRQRALNALATSGREALIALEATQLESGESLEVEDHGDE